VVDAAIVSTEYLPIAPGTVKLLATGREALPNFMRVCHDHQRQGRSPKKPDEAVRFMAAEISALRHAAANRDEEIKLTFEITKGQAGRSAPGLHLRRSRGATRTSIRKSGCRWKSLPGTQDHASQERFHAEAGKSLPRSSRRRSAPKRWSW